MIISFQSSLIPMNQTVPKCLLSCFQSSLGHPFANGIWFFPLMFYFYQLHFASVLEFILVKREGISMPWIDIIICLKFLRIPQSAVYYDGYLWESFWVPSFLLLDVVPYFASTARFELPHVRFGSQICWEKGKEKGNQITWACSVFSD